MLLRFTGSIVGGALFLSLASQAWGVSPIGREILIDVDPESSFYAIGRHETIGTDDGAFAVVWEENTDESASGSEAIKFRVFDSDRSPLTGPASADLSKLRGPISENSFVSLGPSSAYLVYAGRNANDAAWSVYGQPISMTTGKASPRTRLCERRARSFARGYLAGLRNGGAVFACQSFWTRQGFIDIPGRFISPSGERGAAKLQFAVDETTQLASLQTLGDGFLGNYARSISLEEGFETSAQIFKSNGSSAGPRVTLPRSADRTYSTFPYALANNRLLVRSSEQVGESYRLTGRILDSAWKTVVGKKVLLRQRRGFPAGFAHPLPDGGFLLWERKGRRLKAEHSISRFDAEMNKIGKTYSFKAIEFDIGRIAALNASSWLAVYRKEIGGRERLVAQLLRD